MPLQIKKIMFSKEIYSKYTNHEAANTVSVYEKQSLWNILQKVGDKPNSKLNSNMSQDGL